MNEKIKIRRTEEFLKRYRVLPKKIQKKVDKQTLDKVLTGLSDKNIRFSTLSSF